MTQPTRDEMKKAAKRIKKAGKDFEANKISDKKLAKIVIKHKIGIDPEYFSVQDIDNLLKFVANSEKKLSQKYADDDHADRIGFKYNPSYTAFGKIMQRQAKPMIRKAIKLAHWYIEHRYGNDPFRYDSEFTKFTDDMLHEYIDTNFANNDEMKVKMMNDIRDIFGFMQKEDIYYSARFKDFTNTFVAEFNRRYPDGIMLTENEKHNLALWDRPGGNPEVNKALPEDETRS